jgi:hypothetical protein
MAAATSILPGDACAVRTAWLLRDCEVAAFTVNEESDVVCVPTPIDVKPTPFANPHVIVLKLPVH